jgi:RNA polymerase sigma-70 factor (ECF subfamily)
VPDDASLLLAWKDGDRDSGERLLDRHFTSLTRFFRNKTRDPIDDLVQTTMLALLESAGRYRGEGSFQSFLFGIAYNVLRDHIRARARAFDPATDSVCDSAPGPSQALAEKAEQRLLLEGLRRIPLEHQTLLELYYWESMTAPDIATVLGVPVGTIRTRIRRAKTLVEAAMKAVATDARVLESTVTDLETWARSVRVLS